VINKRKLLTIIFLTYWLAAIGQPQCHVTRYDESHGVPSNHITQLLQDEEGFIWFATWNGLCRYDGYEFQIYKPQIGDGCHMKSDRFRNIILLPTNQILCRVDEEDYIFDLQSYRFRDLTESDKDILKKQNVINRQSRSLLNRDRFSWNDSYQTRWTLHKNGQLTYNQDGHEVVYPLKISFNTLTFVMADNRGNLWALDYSSIYKICTDKKRTRRLDINPKTEVRCLFNDGHGRYWVTTKEDKVIRVYSSSDHHLIGYLGSDGHMYKEYISFGAAVYCMYESSDGVLWLGTKPQGIFRLRETSENTFSVNHLDDLPGKDVYHITEDHFGRLWIASLDKGVYLTDKPQDKNPLFHTPHLYPVEKNKRARFLHITNDSILLIATSNGLIVSKLLPDVDKMAFHLHQRDSERKESLSSSATMDILENNRHIFVSTESGGINIIKNRNLLDTTLTFHHVIDEFHVQSNAIVQSIIPFKENKIIAVGSHLITILYKQSPYRVLDARNLGNDYRFSEAHPIALNQGQWIFGLSDGAFMMSEQQMIKDVYTPPIKLTKLTIQNDSVSWAINQMDSLLIQPHQRNITIHFAALDYSASEHINYAFRLLPNEEWNYIGKNRSATLIDLRPDTYQLQIRSTNVDGQWTQNSRTLTIIVKPTFWESIWGVLLIQLLIIIILGIIISTLLYIRKIKRQQRDTLEKYLAVIDSKDKEQIEKGKKDPQETTNIEKPSPAIQQELDPMLQRIMQFVQENISNGDASVGDMAAFAVTSRSGLQRKLKQAMGITPQDLLREARIKHACQLLRQTDKTISEVAYACGFTDPKYFSRCFKQSTGQSPTEYKSL